MFAKLLKYEWRATRGMVGLLCLICLSAALVGGLAMRYLVWVSELDSQSNAFIVLSVLTMIFAFIAIVICCVAMELYAVWRFYKSRFTDEGYLTFTLPVTTHQILLSSFVNCLISMVCALAALMVGYLVLLLLGFSALEGFFPSLWEVMPLAMENLWRLFSGETGAFLAQLALGVVAGVLNSTVMMMLAVTIGSILAKKHKVLAAVGVYYGINMALSLVAGVLGAILGLSVYTSQSSGMDVFSSMMLWNAGLFLIVAVGGYFLTHWLVSRKLNLT